ncbi:hypothetical protein [Aeromonas caviae]|uniref:Uncharacterized protein n=1 Tax=Aeromonas caviae TaxID=648 RepID=A0AAJ6CS63_AERCA|nr:hypothetical protein [Aeromonas caviae]WFG00223.1 hypothetical protein P5S46_22270 [Aeromonas caviae]
MISPEKILCRSLAGVLKHKGIDHEHYVLDGQTYPIASLASELIIQSYVYGVSNIKSHMTLGRDAINCTQIATDDGVVITDDISLHSGAEAMALMASVWRDTLLCADFTAENVIDLTGTRDIWAGYLKSQGRVGHRVQKTGLHVVHARNPQQRVDPKYDYRRASNSPEQRVCSYGSGG